MEYVLISDIHGNAEALKQVIEREGRDANYITLGDITGLNPYPQETVELVREISKHVIAGNHDYSIFHTGYGHTNSNELSDYEYTQTMEALSDEEIEWMRELGYIEVIEEDICLTHAKPWPEDAIGYAMGNAGIPKRDVTHFASVVSDDYDYVFHGHTHEQYSLDCERFGHDVHLVNPGSLGWDGDYATINTETGEVELKNVEFVEEKIKEDIDSKLPPEAPPTRKWY